MAVGQVLPTMDERIARLKEQLSVLPQICVERGQLVTDCYKETDRQPAVIRQALALKRVLSGMSINIHPDELIVGNVTSAPRGAPLLPEVAVDWLEAEIDTFEQRDCDRFLVGDQVKETVRSIARYWKGKTLNEQVFASMGQGLREAYNAHNAVCNIGLSKCNLISHVSVDYEKAIAKGLLAIKEEISEVKASKDPADPGYAAQAHFHEAASICIDAVIGLAARYSALATRLAEEETSPARKEELLQIAEVCSWVPARPARTFHEALQALWFVHIALLLEGFGWAFVPGRLDQYLWPYYKNDVEKGWLTSSRAKELLKFLFVKMNGYTSLISNTLARYFTGFPLTQIITIGGTTPDGKDATNELSYLCLEADSEVGLTQPELVIKVHPGMPEHLLLAACRVAKQHVGKLKFINDEMAVRKLVNCGYAESEARDYVLVGCHEPFVPKMTHYWPAGNLNVAKCLELALNDGRDRLTGQPLGPATGDPRAFTSLTQVIDAFQVQVRYFVEHQIKADEAIYRTIAELLPTPFQSALIRGCIEMGKDCTSRGADHNFAWLSLSGVVNVADSLAAIGKVVFERGEASTADLIDALDSNFAWAPRLLALLRAAPKFGNDEDYVDLLAKEVLSICTEEIQKHRIWGDIILQAAASSNTGNIPHGANVAATPDGRLAREPLGEGGISPVQGRNTSGPTATIRSVAKLDHASMKSGSVLNMRFSPHVLRNEEGLRRFAALIRAYCLLGGYHVQFNIIDGKTLRAAQERPQEYRDLLVRVATYTSYFTELGKELQDNIIERVEFGEV